MKMVLQSGVESLTDDELQLFIKKQLPADHFEKFQKNVFKGWKTAQEIVVSIQEEHWMEGDPKSDPKSHYFYRNTQRLLDCILWHHYGPDMADMKRIYEREPKIQNLAYHNIQKHHEVALHINSDPNKFALITDLTSGIRLGDLFICEIAKPNIFAEVKSGATNIKILEAITKNDTNLLSEISKNEKDKMQLQRILKQADHSNQLMRILKDGVGLDKGMSCKPMKVFEAKRPMETFDKELNTVLDKLRKGESTSVGVVEDCLLFVAVDTFTVASEKISEILHDKIIEFENGTTRPGIKFDLVLTLNESSVMRPIYLQPLDAEHIHDLISRRFHVYFYLSLEKYRINFSSESCTINWIEGKELRKKWAQCNQYALKFQNQSLEFGLRSGTSMLLSNGLFQRLPSNFIKPSYLKYLHEQMLSQMSL